MGGHAGRGVRGGPLAPLQTGPTLGQRRTGASPGGAALGLRGRTEADPQDSPSARSGDRRARHPAGTQVAGDGLGRLRAQPEPGSRVRRRLEAAADATVSLKGLRLLPGLWQIRLVVQDEETADLGSVLFTVRVAPRRADDAEPAYPTAAPLPCDTAQSTAPAASSPGPRPPRGPPRSRPAARGPGVAVPGSDRRWLNAGVS
jgi:hypothetical protein